MANQVINGKTFEYAIVKEYYEYLTAKGVNVQIVEDDTYSKNKCYYESFDEEQQRRYSAAARSTIDTVTKIEPGLISQKDTGDALLIRLAKDSEGQEGDVRDIIFSRPASKWEMGFSAKNNNDAVKHSRLSNILDFGKEWVNVPCSQTYWSEIKPIFQYIDKILDANPHAVWDDLGDEKTEKVYIPLLAAFRKELLYINQNNKSIPQKLISYLIGAHPFYKIIKDDKDNLVIVKAFNIGGKLNKTVNGVKSRYKVAPISLPARIIEFELKPGSNTTLAMVLDGGWEISFRIHNADKPLVHSLKFDVRLLGNPPVLFSQYLFQD